MTGSAAPLAAEEAHCVEVTEDAHLAHAYNNTTHVRAGLSAAN